MEDDGMIDPIMIYMCLFSSTFFCTKCKKSLTCGIGPGLGLVDAGQLQNPVGIELKSEAINSYGVE